MLQPRQLRSIRSFSSQTPPRNWRNAKPLKPGQPFPAKELCSECGLCETSLVAFVKDACAFLGDGMGRLPALEEQTHGRSRQLSGDELHFGVHEQLLLGRMQQPLAGAQWTGIVSSIAIAALRSGLVDGVVCVACSPDNPLKPRPILALTEADVLASRGVKPMLSPSLNVLAEVEARGIKRLLFIGVGCAVQALRSVEKHLALEKLYVLGTNCTDNGREAGLNKFLNAASRATGREAATVRAYEFAADYRVHLKHADGSYEKLPYFCLPADELSRGVIADSCLACFDYTNGSADLVIGYMGAPPEDVAMTEHSQSLTVRNARGAELLALLGDSIQLRPAVSSGAREPLVMETVLTDDRAAMGLAKPPAPRLVGELLASVLTAVGPRGLEFARFSIECAPRSVTLACLCLCTDRSAQTTRSATCCSRGDGYLPRRRRDTCRHLQRRSGQLTTAMDLYPAGSHYCGKEIQSRSRRSC